MNRKKHCWCTLHQHLCALFTRAHDETILAKNHWESGTRFQADIVCDNIVELLNR